MTLGGSGGGGDSGDGGRFLELSPLVCPSPAYLMRLIPF